MVRQRQRKTRWLVLLLLVASFVLPVYAEEDNPKRWVNLDWEPVEGAKAYQVEITRILAEGERKKPVLFKVKEARWKAKINPGQYEMRLRSYDARGVPGLRSEAIDFWVKLKAPKLIAPVAKDRFETNEEKEFEVQFKWLPEAGATEYLVEVKNEKGEVIVSDKFSETEASIELPVASSYQWRVTAVMGGGALGEQQDFAREFLLLGKKLETPKIEKPAHRFVQKLNWQLPAYTENFSYRLHRKKKNGKWKRIESVKKTDLIEIPFAAKYRGGTYRLQVKAHAKGRPSSDTSQVIFPVHNGSRTPAAMERTLLKESIEKPKPLYFVASYQVTMIDYMGVNKETGGQPISFDAVGGTGRLGVGYFNKKSHWGAFGIVDLAGFNVGEQNFTYASAELQGTYRIYFLRATQMRFGAGFYYKQMPEVVQSSTFDDQLYIMRDLSVMGPHVGFQLWHPFSYKLGMQVKARAYMSMAGSTESGGEIIPEITYQVGLLGSYRLSQDMVGYAGYLYRKDTVSYMAKPGDPFDPDSDSFAVDGDVNTLTLTGHYLNLVLEYSF
jgi:hypothetical protein